MTSRFSPSRLTSRLFGQRSASADSADPAVVFIHIPKAGGQSFRTLIEANYPKAAWMPIYRTGGTTMDEVFAKVPPERLRRKRIVYGHIPHTVERYLPRPCRYFTILREPVSRSISVYKYIKHDFDQHARHESFASGKRSFAQFCRNPRAHANIMTKLIAGHEQRSTADAAMLEQAIENLRKMAVVGLFEDYEASVNRICETFGWSNRYETRNRSSKTNDAFLAAEGARKKDLTALRDANEYDVRLYEEGRRLYTAGA